MLRRVPFQLGYAETGGLAVFLVGCFSGMVFGGIHCVGWNFPFQSHTEQVLWRVVSFAVLCTPIFIAIDYSYMAGSWAFFDLGGLLLCITLLVGFAYIAARLTLIVLILLSFRSLPPGVYDTVAWTRFIPHL
ncbi:hypothetical protein M405DRAFT_925020 [Rhizopogon salebrosus TDB-379]|nr:hypothetical protein M405DRAFT_926143 [Rhizopogon salebrosus TDB-379]KAJ8597138.1 hypothetical protein M405DRAFT_925020 [Rhizopogon salebrosus TDB-379]